MHACGCVLAYADKRLTIFITYTHPDQSTHSSPAIVIIILKGLSLLQNAEHTSDYGKQTTSNTNEWASGGWGTAKELLLKTL